MLAAKLGAPPLMQHLPLVLLATMAHMCMLFVVFETGRKGRWIQV